MPSNFGEERTFTEGANTVRGVPRLNTLDGDTVAEVIITKMDGERRAVERMAATIKKTYTGALYETWQRGT